MDLYQGSIFGNFEQIIPKSEKKPKEPKKLSNKNKVLKCKLKKLYKLYEILYDRQNISILEPREIIIKGGITVYTDERQAEPSEDCKLNVLDDIDKRIEHAEEKVEQLQFDFMKDFV